MNVAQIGVSAKDSASRNFLSDQHTRQEPAELTRDDAVTRTCMSLQPFAIADGNGATTGVNHAGVLQLPDRRTDSFAPYTQHFGNQLMTHLYLVAGHPARFEQ